MSLASSAFPSARALGAQEKTSRGWNCASHSSWPGSVPGSRARLQRRSYSNHRLRNTSASWQMLLTWAGFRKTEVAKPCCSLQWEREGPECAELQETRSQKGEKGGWRRKFILNPNQLGDPNQLCRAELCQQTQGGREDRNIQKTDFGG